MIFRKQVSVFIAMLVLVSNSGLAFNIHFCEGKIASVTSVFSKEEVCAMPVAVEKSCCSKVETTHGTCCSDKEVNLKDDVEKVLLKISFDHQFFYVFQECTAIEFVKLQQVLPSNTLEYYCNANAPPLYQLYCQFTLYA
jgi:hypothetical protein